MAEEQAETEGFNLQQIVELAVTTSGSLLLREFTKELAERGVSVNLINEVIDIVHERMADYRRQYEGANLVQLMLDHRKEKNDGAS